MKIKSGKSSERMEGFCCVMSVTGLSRLCTGKADDDDNDVDVGFEVLTAVIINGATFWDVTLCTAIDDYQSFGGTCYLHLQSRRIRFPILLIVGEFITVYTASHP
jgi:hypothetical protein